MKSGVATITPFGHNPPTQSLPLPYESSAPKRSSCDTPGGGLKGVGSVTGQRVASAIVTPEGEHVFLEVNQMGQFLFLERYAGVPLLDAFAEFLFQARPDFDWEEGKVKVRYADVLRAVPRMEADLARRHVQPLDRSVREDTEQTSRRQASAR